MVCIMSPAAGHAWHPKLTLSALALVLAGVAAPASAANFQYRVPIVTLVTTGTWHACAIAARRAQCWGRSDFGQLGNSAVSGDQLTPIDVQP